MISSLVLCGCFLIFAWLLDSFLRRLKRLRSKLEKQGIGGPSPSLLYGNIAEIRKINDRVRENQVKRSAGCGVKPHSWPCTALPHLLQWRDEYGPISVYATGNIQILCVTNTDMVKEISLRTSLNLGKPTYLSKDQGPLLCRGILTSNGPYWAYQRKIVAPEFYLDKLTMVIQETLCLYLPVAFVVREALEDIKFKEIHVPKGINVQIPTPILHQHQDLWGSDAPLFKPYQFAKGIAGACKIPQAYMPFGVGPVGAGDRTSQ